MSEFNIIASIPPVPKVHDSISDMEQSIVEDLLNNNRKLSEWIVAIPEIKSVEEIKHKMLESNILAATENEVIVQKMKTLYKNIKMLHLELDRKMIVFRQLQANHSNLCSLFDEAKIFKQLEMLKIESFDLSENIAFDWLERNDEKKLDDFVKSFLAKRIQHHVNASKIERLSFILNI